MAKAKFTIITLFQDALAPYLSTSMMWKATKNNIAEFSFVDLREFGLGPHKSVDDTPYGGGDGMLLRCEPVFAAIEKIKQDVRFQSTFLVDQDPVKNKPLPSSSFSPTAESWKCETCTFRKVCHQLRALE